MKQFLSVLVLIFILAFLLFCIKKILSSDNSFKEAVIGKKVLLNKDTLEVINQHWLLKNTFILSNNQEVSIDYINKHEVK